MIAHETNWKLKTKQVLQSMHRNRDGSAGDVMFALKMLWSELERSSASASSPHLQNFVGVGEGRGGREGSPDMDGSEAGRRRFSVELVVAPPPPTCSQSADQGCEWVQELQASMRQVVAAVELSTIAINRQGDLSVIIIYMYHICIVCLCIVAANVLNFMDRLVTAMSTMADDRQGVHISIYACIYALELSTIAVDRQGVTYIYIHIYIYEYLCI